MLDFNQMAFQGGRLERAQTPIWKPLPFQGLTSVPSVELETSFSFSAHSTLAGDELSFSPTVLPLWPKVVVFHGVPSTRDLGADAGAGHWEPCSSLSQGLCLTCIWM